MIDIAYIRRRIARDVFDYQELATILGELRKPRDKIRRLLARGDIVRIRKGLYAFGEAYRRGPICREWLANLIYGPSYVSLDYALSYYGLIPERVREVTSVTPGRSRAFETPFGVFSYRRLGERRYAVGATLERAGEERFLIATPEKALVDTVWADKRFAAERLSDFESYLFDDLRLDPEAAAALDRERLAEIDRAWASPKIRRLVKFLTAQGERVHA